MTTVQTGALANTTITWRLERRRVDTKATLRAVAELAEAAHPETRAVLLHLSSVVMDELERLTLLEMVLTALRVRWWAARATWPLCERVDVALAQLRHARQEDCRDRLWARAQPGGPEKLIGVIEHTRGEWWGYMPDVLGGGSLGPHEDDECPALIDRMVRRAHGLPENWYVAEPPLADVIPLLRPVAGPRGGAA